MEHIGELHSFRAETPTDAPQGTAQGQSQSQSQGGQAQSQSHAPATAEAAKARSPASAEDFAHMFVGAARALDIPARYVTGYLAGSDEAEASFHAWAEAYDDSLGWIAFDAALGYCPTDQHVRLATGLDSLTTMPLRSVPNGSKPEHVTLSVDTGQQ
jgi:transglutaminase-like putative cysteine protease